MRGQKGNVPTFLELVQPLRIDEFSLRDCREASWSDRLRGMTKWRRTIRDRGISPSKMLIQRRGEGGPVPLPLDRVLCCRDWRLFGGTCAMRNGSWLVG
jgi:hypothetical protein